MKKIPMEKVKPKKHGALWWIFIGWWWCIYKALFILMINAVITLFTAITGKKKENNHSETVKKYETPPQPVVFPSEIIQKPQETKQPKTEFSCGNVLNGRIDDFILAYDYKNDICFIDKSNVKKLIDKGGKEITFRLEPTNPYDSNAIQILLEGEAIGYVYKKGNTQEMIHNWIKKGWEFFAYICQYSIEKEKASYYIGFYKPVEMFETKSYRLTKISRKCDEYASQSRFEALESCEEGEEVEIGYDHGTMSYVVTSKYGEEIGEMPSKFETDVEESRRYYAEIESLEIEDTAEAIIKVYI